MLLLYQINFMQKSVSWKKKYLIKNILSNYNPQLYIEK